MRSRVNGSGCPACANRVIIPGENDLATTYPELARQWHPQKNGALTPHTVTAGTHKKVWWRCEKGHEWQASILARSQNSTGCPACAGRQVIPGENDLATFLPHIAAQWHPSKNGALLPTDVTVYSNRRVWWMCELGHEYAAVIAQRAKSFSACPYCTGRKVLPGFNDLETKEPVIAAQWHPDLNGALTPRMVTVGSNKKVWWQCPSGHVWKAVVHSRATGRKHGCPVCAGNAKIRTQSPYISVPTQKSV